MGAARLAHINVLKLIMMDIVQNSNFNCDYSNYTLRRVQELCLTGSELK
jgi:hypothetical protein